MKADPSLQAQLLELQAVDTRLAQLAHRRAHLPEQQALDAAEAALAAADSDVVKARTSNSDVARDVAKAEADVALVRERAARDQARMAAGGSAKELSNLQHELDSLARRQAVLEDEQLEIMERAEAVAALLAHAETRQGELRTSRDEARVKRDDAVADLDAQTAEASAQRGPIAAGLEGPLLDLYEKIRAQTGMGAAAVVARRCEGCRLELLGADVARIKAAPADEVIRCEECRRIMVRTAESGL